MDDPFRRIIPGNSSMNTNYPDSSSGRMIRLFARIYTQTNYQTNYRSLPKFVPDWRRYRRSRWGFFKLLSPLYPFIPWLWMDGSLFTIGLSVESFKFLKRRNFPSTRPTYKLWQSVIFISFESRNFIVCFHDCFPSRLFTEKWNGVIIGT